MDAPGHSASSAVAARPTLRILIVDDEAGRDACRCHLCDTEAFASDISEASTATEAWDLCRARRFDCLLVDDTLIDASGLRFTENLVAAAGVKAPPVILMTGNGSEQLAVDAMRAGCADYISKDRLTAASLNRAVENAVEKSVLRRKVESRSRSLERSNAELRRKTDEITRFYHSVSHEIKTPLTAAREFIALTLEGIGGGITVAQREFLEHALNSCDDIARHFDDLVDATRLETGKMRIVCEPAMLATTVARALGSAAAFARDRGVLLRNRVPGDLPPVDIDCGRIVQVIANLVHNAIKFSPRGGLVDVSARTGSGWVEVCVADNGCGIAEDHLDRIFDRLYQVDAGAAAGSQPGLGLGLYISREIARLHGSDLEVASRIGQGSTFRFNLPFASARSFKPVNEMELS